MYGDEKVWVKGTQSDKVIRAAPTRRGFINKYLKEERKGVRAMAKREGPLRKAKSMSQDALL